MPKAKAQTTSELVAALFDALPASYSDDKVGGRIAKRRKELGMTHQTLAHKSSCSVTTLSLIELGHRRPSLLLLM